METIMLDAISEDSNDAILVDRAKKFVTDMRAGCGASYITSDRLELKSCLSTTWAIQSPEKVFSQIDEQIKTVNWGKYDVMRKCFGLLGEL